MDERLTRLMNNFRSGKKVKMHKVFFPSGYQCKKRVLNSRPPPKKKACIEDVSMSVLDSQCSILGSQSSYAILCSGTPPSSPLCSGTPPSSPLGHSPPLTDVANLRVSPVKCVFSPSPRKPETVESTSDETLVVTSDVSADMSASGSALVTENASDTASAVVCGDVGSGSAVDMVAKVGSANGGTVAGAPTPRDITSLLEQLITAVARCEEFGQHQCISARLQERLRRIEQRVARFIQSQVPTTKTEIRETVYPCNDSHLRD